MRDGDVRTALHHHLADVHAHELFETRFVDELGLCGEVRVDVAVINGHLAGYELKSERDNLRRLPKQVDFYSRVLDWAYLVVAEGHLDRAKRMLPAWWGVLVASTTSSGVVLSVEREPDENPGVSPEYLVRLLWREELLRELDVRGLASGIKSKPRPFLAALLSSSIPVGELRAVVRESLKYREGWRSG